MPDAIQSAVAVLKEDGVIAYPTEAVFGLGCDPNSDPALQRLLDLKQRPAEKGLIIIAADLEQVLPYIQPLTDAQRKKLQASWPGRVTWLLPVNPAVSKLLVGEHNSIAARVTPHPVASELCRQFGKPLVSTSANLSGREPARSVGEVREQFGDQLDAVIDGEVDMDGKPSEIRDLISDKIIREG